MAFDLDVTKRLGETEVALRLEADSGITVLFGPSGVGKTSVLNMVAGLLRPDLGHIRVGGATLFDATTDIPPERRRVGYVFQDSRLFPHLRVRQNLAYANPQPPFALSSSRGIAQTVLRQAQHERLEQVATMLGIAQLLDRWPGTLSGGEAKRVAIGRALLSDPAFLLLDEPTASLDRVRADEVERAIIDVRHELGLPILMVTHDRAEAERLATRIVEMQR